MKINNKKKTLSFQNMLTCGSNILTPTDAPFNEMVYLVLQISETVALF